MEGNTFYSLHSKNTRFLLYQLNIGLFICGGKLKWEIFRINNTIKMQDNDKLKLKFGSWVFFFHIKITGILTSHIYIL